MNTPAFDTHDWRVERDKRLHNWMQGNTEAVDFLLTVFYAAELWDDIADGDFAKAREAVDAVMWKLLIDLPGNSFFVAWRHQLQGVMAAGINAWMDSAVLEKKQDSWSTVWAYALRDWYMELVPFCALLVGDHKHMRAVSLEARQFFQAESLEEYRHGNS